MKRATIKQQADFAEVWLYGDIGESWGEGISAKTFAEDINALDVPNMTVHINSVGGDVWEGFAMNAVLKRHKAHVKVTIDGITASAATLPALAGDEIEMSTGSFFMIHNPWTIAAGNSADFREIADFLDTMAEPSISLYAQRTGQSRQQITEWMDAETWFSDQEAVDAGFADSVAETVAIAASADLRRFDTKGRLPDAVAALLSSKQQSPPPAKWRLEAAKAALTLMR